jgi:formylmethanofuran dehydrogenase subunit B
MPRPVRFLPFFCGLPCTPMTLETRPDGLAVVEGGCPICRTEVTICREEDLPPLLAGKTASLADAIRAAGTILRDAGSPFVYGLSRSASETARRAAAVAAAARGSIDVEGSESVQPDLLALQTYGLPSATFGEIRDRSDLLLLWRCDPRPTHPRLFARTGRRGSPAAPERAAIVIPPLHGTAARPAGPDDLIVPIEDGGDLAAALALRALVNGAAPEGVAAGGVGLDVLREAAARLRGARYSAVLWSPQATDSVHGVAIASALTLLARDLNRFTRSVARPLGAGGNVAGAMSALAAATGYPRAIGFFAGVPRYGPAEFDATRMLGAAYADAVLYVGAVAAPDGESAAGRSAGSRTKEDAGRGGRARGPAAAVVIGPRLPRGITSPDVFIPTAAPGLRAAGTALRADGVTVVLRAVLPTRRPTEDEALDALLDRLAPAERPRG